MDTLARFNIHGIFRLHIENFVETVNIREDAVDPEFSRGMRDDLQNLINKEFCSLISPYMPIRKEETFQGTLPADNSCRIQSLIHFLRGIIAGAK